MKKAILFLACLITGSYSADAQWVSGGPELGLNLSNLSTSGATNNGVRAGLKVGGVIDIGFTDHFSIQPGLFYDAMGAHQNSSATTTTGNTTTTTQSKYDYRIDYLQLPVNFQFKFGYTGYGNFFAGAGPYLSYALGGKVQSDNGTYVTRANGTTTLNDKQTSYNLMVGNNGRTDDVKPLDAGFNVNAGYEFPMGLFMRANYGQGLVNIVPGGDSNDYMHNWGFTFSAGFMFGE